jgi:hypothetical protein
MIGIVSRCYEASKLLVPQGIDCVANLKPSTTSVHVRKKWWDELGLNVIYNIILFAQGGSPTPHPFSSRPHFVCKFSRQMSTEVY